MSLVCDIRPQGRHEVVISESPLTEKAHKDLFRFDDDAYRIVGEGLFEALRQSVSAGALVIHVSGGWQRMLGLALWKEERPSRGEVFFLLKGLGVTEEELRPFSNSDCDDIFHNLYYGQRFDVLRRLCFKAKKVSEANLARDGSVRVNCHLVAVETDRIVASSL